MGAQGTACHTVLTLLPSAPSNFHSNFHGNVFSNLYSESFGHINYRTAGVHLEKLVIEREEEARAAWVACRQREQDLAFMVRTQGKDAEFMGRLAAARHKHLLLQLYYPRA